MRDERGIIVDFEIERRISRASATTTIARTTSPSMLVSTMMNKIRMYPSYRNAIHTQSVLTITSNVVYGKATGNTPDGRKKGEPFAPGANPSNGRDTHGALAALMSVAKIPYDDAEDGISLTLSVVPSALGSEEERIARGVNALGRVFLAAAASTSTSTCSIATRCRTRWSTLRSIRSSPIRVSGYAVNFVKLTREQQLDVINRTFHGSM